MEKIGFIGAGNMAAALMRGIHRKMPQMKLAAFDIHSEPLNALKRDAGIEIMDDNDALAKWAELIVIGVKPNVVESVALQIASKVQDKPVLSIAMGIPTEKLASWMPGARILRVMPNTPALVGEGATVMSEQHTLLPQELETARMLFESVGHAAMIPEKLFAAATAVSGCGPAYYYLLMEAMADAGVKYGLPRQLAYELAAQTTLGAGKMLRDLGQHPGALKDAVCSPGGGTIQGIDALEKSGARAAMIRAVDASYQKAKETE